MMEWYSEKECEWQTLRHTATRQESRWKTAELDSFRTWASFRDAGLGCVAINLVSGWGHCAMVLLADP